MMLELVLHGLLNRKHPSDQVGPVAGWCTVNWSFPTLWPTGWVSHLWRGRHTTKFVTGTRSKTSSVSIFNRLQTGRTGLLYRQGQGIFSLRHHV